MLTLDGLRSWLSKTVAFLTIATIMYIASSENLFETFIPRAYCMALNNKLIAMHLIADSIMFMNSAVMGYLMYNIYKSFAKRPIPFKGFLWLFAIGCILVALTHLMGVINLFVTYYWLDALIKFLAGWFALGVTITFIRTVKEIKGVKTPEQYEQLAEELRKLKKQLNIED